MIFPLIFLSYTIWKFCYEFYKGLKIFTGKCTSLSSYPLIFFSYQYNSHGKLHGSLVLVLKTQYEDKYLDQDSSQHAMPCIGVPEFKFSRAWLLLPSNTDPASRQRQLKSVSSLRVKPLSVGCKPAQAWGGTHLWGWSAHRYCSYGSFPFSSFLSLCFLKTLFSAVNDDRLIQLLCLYSVLSCCIFIKTYLKLFNILLEFL